MNRAQRMLSVLDDYRPHTRGDIFKRVGFLLTNNAASELRAKGHDVSQWYEKGEYVYQLVPLDRLPAPSPAGSQSSGPPTCTESEVTSCAMGEKETRRGGPLTSSGPEPRAAFPASQLDNPRAASGPEQLPIFEVRKEPAWR